MKKVITILVALATLAMAATSFAATIGTSGGTSNTDVKGNYIAAEHTDVYKVDITWGGMEFDFNAGDRTWNTTNHVWESAKGTWTIKTGSSNEIKIDNHSSTAVNVDIKFESTEASVSGSVENNSFTLDAPTTAAATTNTAVFMPDGTLESTFTDYAKIGSLTVGID